MLRFVGPAILVGGLGIKWSVNAYKRWAIKNMGKRNSGKAGATNIYNFPGGFQRHMTAMEAVKILGITDAASNEEIHKAWSHLIKINHPDMGGSSYLTEKVNEAKGVLGK